MSLRAQARVDLGAIERNAARLAAVAAPAALCAVVKGDGYGHGMVPAARAARAGGARWLAVATADEARGLRAAGIEGPVLVMGALSPQELEVALAAGADVVAWRERFVERLAPGAAGPRQARHRHGAAGHARPRGGDARGRGGRRARRPAAGGRHDPLRHRRRRPRLHGRAARALHAVGGGAQGRPPRPPRPRRQLGRHARRARRPLRPRALRHRRLRHGPVPRGPGPRTGSSRRSRSSPTSPRPRPPRPARARATAAASWPRRRPAWARCRSATPTACAAR